MENINKNTLIIFGYSEIITVGLLVNSKLEKVKEFNILEDNNEDIFFIIISSFISYKTCFKNVFYSCGPGGFTIIRRIISYVKALKFNNYSNTKFIGLNHLFIIAFYLDHNFKINDQEYILSILNHSKDNYVQIYQKKKKPYFFLNCLSEIKSVDIDIIEPYLETLNLPTHNVHTIYLGENPNCVPIFTNIKFVDRSKILEIIIKISDLFENNKINQIDHKYFIEEKFNPIYGKLPSTS